jgi:Predicted P-loop ATPase fused to an acetyltransferase
MVRKKLDERVRTLIERGVVKNERSILVLVGDHGKDQVPNIHHLLTRTSVRARPKVLWCYKKELGFSTHRMKVCIFLCFTPCFPAKCQTLVFFVLSKVTHISAHVPWMKKRE